MKKILAPTYINDFLCIASECPRTCCNRWTVTMDKEKYDKLMNCPDDIMRESFERNIVRFMDKARYARVKFDECGKCPYLNSDMLCNIQLRLGEPWLPNACSYPRRSFSINNNWEMSMVLSCPVSAYEALFNAEKMKFEEFESEKPELYVKFDCCYGYEKFRVVRDFLIEILQDRSCAFWLRLLFLGIFIKRAYSLDFDKTIDEIKRFRDYMTKNESTHRFNALTPDYKKQFDLITYMLGETSKRPPIAEYGELLKVCANGLNRADDGKNGGYIKVTRQLNHHEKDIDLIFENFFVNEIFRNPLAICGLFEDSHGKIEKDGAALFKAYLEWCALYRLNYFQLACLLSEFEVLDDNLIVTEINLTCRATTMHDKSFASSLTSHMIAQGYDDVDKIALLLAQK